MKYLNIYHLQTWHLFIYTNASANTNKNNKNLDNRNSIKQRVKRVQK